MVEVHAGGDGPAEGPDIRPDLGGGDPLRRLLRDPFLAAHVDVDGSGVVLAVIRRPHDQILYAPKMTEIQCLFPLNIVLTRVHHQFIMLDVEISQAIRTVLRYWTLM